MPRGISATKTFLALLFILCFIFSGSALRAEQYPIAQNQNWIQLIQNENQVPEVNLLKSDFGQVEFEVQIPAMLSEEMKTKGGIFNRLSIPEYGITNVVGEPQLPVIRKMIQIPFGAEIELQLISSQVEEKTLGELGIQNRIMPVQPPIPKIEGALEKAEFIINENTYQKDSFNPTELLKKGEIGIIRGHRFVVVEISPISYNPAKGKLRIYSDIKVRINLINSDITTTRNMLSRYASPPFEELCQDLFINYPTYQDMIKGAPALPIGYLIIVHDNFQSQAAPLAEWKKKKGFNVTVATTSQTGTTTASIKNYIQNAYNNWPIPPTYVLFFGDVGFIPTYTGTYSSTATDLYYVQMNSDRFGDIFRARFPVRTTAEATNMVNKLLYYEDPNSADLEWMRHDLFIASLDNYAISEGTHRFVIQNYLIPNGNIIDSLWERLGCTATQITNSINAGKAIVCYSGHGSTTSWATGSYGQSNINSLSNTNEYPLILSHACLTGQFDLTECFGETWVKAQNKGGIAFWGASNSSYWDEDDILERRMFKAAFQDTCYSVASMTDKALWYLFQYYGDVTNVKYYFDMYNVLGDPSIDIWTYIANDLTASFPNTIPMLPSYAVPITVHQNANPMYGALVCLKKGTEVFQSGYTDASGQLTLYVSPATLGYMGLTITAHNQLPLEDSILVIPPGDAYLTFEGYHIDDDSLGASRGNNNGLMDFGETIELSSLLKNFGDSSAHNTYGKLTTTNSQVSIIGDSAFWGEVLSNDTATCKNPFVFTVSGQIPDKTVVPFHLNVFATNGNWGFDTTLLAHAPILVYDHKQIHDIVGNGNNKPDPGEICDMNVTLKNDGSAGENSISAQLTCSDPYVTVTVSNAAYPDIPAGAIGSSFTSYRFNISNNCPMGHHAAMVLHISGWGSYITEDTFEVLIGQTPILFVDDDGGSSYENYFLPALDSVGFLYDVWTYATQGAPTDSVLDAHQAVVWNTGPDYGTTSNPKTLNPTDKARLTTYLDNGGNLFLSSQDLLLDNNPDNFIINYLHVAGHADDQGENSVAGIDGDTISDGMAFSINPPFYNFSDYIVPGTSAAGIFRVTSKGSTIPRAGVQLDDYSKSSADTFCALRYPALGSSTYKVVFLAFPFEGVSQSGAYPDNSYTLMRRIMSWFGLGKTTPSFLRGDANGDQIVDIGDVVYLINYLYKNGESPTPMEAGDANCDGVVDVGDVVYLINYLFKAGGQPGC